MRRTDFLPVGEAQPDEVLERGLDSESSDEEDGAGLEYAFNKLASCIMTLGVAFRNYLASSCRH